MTGEGGSFILQLPMGVLTACLPTEAEWQRRAPTWSRTLWPILRMELEAWCRDNDAEFQIDPRASVYPA